MIDLGAGDDRLLEPQLSYRIKRPGDRPFVSAQHVPLFTAKGRRTALD